MSENDDTHHVTQLLGEIAEGKTSAKGKLIAAVYDQLRKIAQVRMNAERPEHTLQATELVHEAYLKISPGLEGHMHNRYDFYGAAVEAMRRILIDHARRRNTAKHGGGIAPMALSNVAELANDSDPHTVIAFNEAFEALEAEEPQLAELVRLRFFAGLTVEETAEVLKTSKATVKRRWHLARTILYEALDRKKCEPIRPGSR